MSAGPTSTQGTNYLDEVRRIDGIWANISCSSRRVEDIIELKNCIAGVATSMRGGNYEKAAYCVQRFRLINGGVATGAMVGEVGEHERAFMTRMQRELRRTVIEKFDAAVASMVVLLAPRNSPLTLYGLLNGVTICPNTPTPVRTGRRRACAPKRCSSRRHECTYTRRHHPPRKYYRNAAGCYTLLQTFRRHAS